MTHFEDEGHYQEHINAMAQAEMEAQMQQAESEAKAEIDLGEKQDMETLPLSFGEKLVGITFNPSNDDKVYKAKRLCGELADLIKDDYMSKESSTMGTRLFEHAIGEILNAQMNAVKVLTFKN